MKRTNWFKDAVIYQIYPRSFLDSDGDGFGDIPGIISKLDYLKELGVNCIWLSPINDSPQIDNGYDISNYYDIYPPFGTLEDTKKLIKKAHDRGIRIIMDLVVNHTSDKHQWFQDVINNKNSKYKDYYIIRKGRKGGKKPPTNWTGFFSEKAWEKLPNSDDEYYLHLFAKGQPDLNWENPKLREEVKNILKYWLNMGIDGFRCDVINLISKRQSFKNGFPLPALTGHKNYINGPRLHEYLNELYEDVYSKYDSMTVGETVFTNIDKAIELTSPEKQELDMIFNFEHTDTDNYFGVKYFYRKFKLRRLKRVVNKWQKGLYQKGWNSLFIENHDQRRSVGRFGTEEGEYQNFSSKCLAMTYFLLPGTPFIYQGQEIGMTNAHFESIDETDDVELKNIYSTIDKLPFAKKRMKELALVVSRDNARTPMCWDDTKYAGFSNSKPWLRVNKNKDVINVNNALQNKESLFYFYQSLIDFRKNNIEIIKDGRYVDLLPYHSKIYAYKVMDEKGKGYVVISNFSSKRVKCKLAFLDSEIVLSNYHAHNKDYLFPFETRLIKL